MSVHVISGDRTCAVCGTAQAHAEWVRAHLARITASPLSPWAASQKARIDTARKEKEGASA